MSVTSGLSFSPLAAVPVYSATKAAFHSFTLSLRHQLGLDPHQVVEIAPPAVDTDLGGPGLHTFGVNVDEFADSVMKRVEAGELEVGFGFSESARLASRQQLDVFRADESAGRRAGLSSSSGTTSILSLFGMPCTVSKTPRPVSLRSSPDCFNF